MNNDKLQNRIFWLDAARVCAVLCISLNHAVNRAFNPYNQMEEFLNSSLQMQIVKAVLTTCSWLGVPLFLMITGTLFLKRNINSVEDIRKFYKRNVITTLIAAMMWLLFGYLFITLYIDGTIGKALTSVSGYFFHLIHTVLFFNTTSFASLWYMAMIIPLYTILPVLTVYINKFSISGLKIPVLIILMYGFIVPTLNKYLLLFEVGVTLDFWPSYYKIVTPFLIFVLAGYYISLEKLARFSNVYIFFGFTLSFFVTVSCQLEGYSRPYDLTTSYDSLGILITSFFLFEIFRRYAEQIHKLRSCVIFISNRAFGIYMLHIFIIETIRKWISDYNIRHSVQLLLFWIVSVSLSVLIIWILEKNSWCKKNLLLIKD